MAAQHRAPLGRLDRMRTRIPPAAVLSGAQVALLAALAVAVIGWRDPDASLRILIPLLGVALLAVAIGLRRTPGGRWAAIVGARGSCSSG
jgi:hypothetical protein